MASRTRRPGPVLIGQPRTTSTSRCPQVEWPQGQLKDGTISAGFTAAYAARYGRAPSLVMGHLRPRLAPDYYRRPQQWADSGTTTPAAIGVESGACMPMRKSCRGHRRQQLRNHSCSACAYGIGGLVRRNVNGLIGKRISGLAWGHVAHRAGDFTRGWWVGNGWLCRVLARIGALRASGRR